MDLVSLGHRTDLALLQAGGSEVADRGDHLVVRSLHNPTHRRGNFLLLPEVPGAEESDVWLGRFAAEFPDAGHVSLGFDGRNGTVSELGWFTERGFNAKAQTVMTAKAVHEPAHSNRSVVCRRLKSDEDWAQSVELRLRCNQNAPEPNAQRILATANTQTNRRLVKAGHGGWFGAFTSKGRLVAQMGMFAAGRSLARSRSVETDPEYRRQGIAGSLIHRVSQYGFDSLAARVVVIIAAPNYFPGDLYRAVGFRPSESQLQTERPPVHG